MEAVFLGMHFSWGFEAFKAKRFGGFLGVELKVFQVQPFQVFLASSPFCAHALLPQLQKAISIEAIKPIAKKHVEKLMLCRAEFARVLPNCCARCSL